MFQIRDVKFLLEAIGIMSLCQYSWSIGLQIDFLDTHGILHIVNTISFNLAKEILAWGSWNFELVQLFLINWIVDSFMHYVHFLFYLVMDKYLLEFRPCANSLCYLNMSSVCTRL